MEQLKEQERINEVRSYLLDARENYPEPYYMLEYNGVPFSTLGGIQALSGQKKNGKTFVLAQIMAAILGTGTERVEQYLPGLKVPERTMQWLGHEPTVLYVDTEMEKLNSAKVLRRVHWLCNWDMDVPNKRFNVLWLRGVTDVKNSTGEVKERAYEKRYRLIRQAIDWLQPDAVFIDGIRDIIGDFNDNKESAQLVGDLLSKRASTKLASVRPSYRPGVTLCSLDDLFPSFITDAMREALPLLGRKLRGFDYPDAVLTGPETRSSSPVRIPRGEDFVSIDVRGLYPCGEGAGYAGGITSAAVDGVRCAEAVLCALRL